MSLNTKQSRTSTRLVEAVSARLAADPTAQIDVSAFVRVVVDSFIASEAPIENTRALGVRLNSKVEEVPTSLAVPVHILAHYKRYAKAAGGHTFGALVSTALALHYFGAAPAPVPAPAVDEKVAGKAPVKGWRAILQALDIGQTREFTRADLATTLHRASRNIFATADAVRDALPDFRVTTRKTPRILYITRLA